MKNSPKITYYSPEINTPIFSTLLIIIVSIIIISCTYIAVEYRAPLNSIQYLNETGTVEIIGTNLYYNTIEPISTEELKNLNVLSSHFKIHM